MRLYFRREIFQTKVSFKINITKKEKKKKNEIVAQSSSQEESTYKRKQEICRW